ncbi:nodulation protein NfeD [bacterium]|nr:nodulation protein NfeD [bacterium]
MTKYISSILILLALFQSVFAFNAPDSIEQTPIVYKYELMMEIGSTTWVHTQYAFEEAQEMGAAAILIHMNTYGGQVVFADSIRTKILNSKIPVYVFVDNNAASAGALIAIACDGIYMRPGANIGAATVVNQSGEKMPDKYQSYMRSTIRATAESHGKDTIVSGTDTAFVWKRDPAIAEAMVDERVYIEGVIDTGKVLTFTALEAIDNGFCEGQAESVNDVIEKIGYKDHKLESYKPSFYSGLKGFLTNPIFHGILILVMMGGIYFEMQSPGIGFPLMAALIAAVLYFAPLYIDGLAENWEILLFVAGIILIGLEIFVVPGFGVTGISGITLVITGLVLSMVGNVVFDFSRVPSIELVKALVVVLSGSFLSFFISIPLAQKLFSEGGAMANVALQASQDVDKGFVGVVDEHHMVGKTGIAQTVLRPSGKVLIDDETYDAVAEVGMIEKGDEIKVVRYSSGQLYVFKA